MGMALAFPLTQTCLVFGGLWALVVFRELRTPLASAVFLLAVRGGRGRFPERGRGRMVPLSDEWNMSPMVPEIECSPGQLYCGGQAK